VNVGWQVIRFVERADPDEANERPGARVVAPDGDSTPGASGDSLALALAEGVSTISGSPPSSVTLSASIIAFRANDAPLSRWHQRQWQQCTKSGRLSRR